MNSSPNEKSGILGGTFDPVHDGHLGLARDIQKQLNLDEVWFIPARQSPHKQNQTPAGARHRLNMLKAALSPYPNFQISEIELERNGISYTINTLNALQNRYPGRDWHLILGMDAFQDFASWKSVREILQSAHLAVATRPGTRSDLAPSLLASQMKNLPFDYPLDREENGTQTFRCRETGKTIVCCDIESFDISSSEIRDRIKRGKSIKKMLPPEVERYIMTHLLYQANPQPRPE